MRLHFVKGGKPGIRSDGERQGSHLLLRRKYCRKAFDARLTACISARDDRLFTYPSRDGIDVWTSPAKISGCAAKLASRKLRAAGIHSDNDWPKGLLAVARNRPAIPYQTCGPPVCACPEPPQHLLPRALTNRAPQPVGRLLPNQHFESWPGTKPMPAPASLWASLAFAQQPPTGLCHRNDRDSLPIVPCRPGRTTVSPRNLPAGPVTLT